MKIIDLQKRDYCETLIFPDGQQHLRLHNISCDDAVEVVARIKNAEDLYYLMSISNALEIIGAHKVTLRIPYLMGARSDRVFVDGDCVDLEVVAHAINECCFPQVLLYDVHNEIALELIHNSYNIGNASLIKLYDKKEAVLICPDKGAVTKSKNIYANNQDQFDCIVFCQKERDVKGNLTLSVESPDMCEGKDCVIVDDLCDGGGTFMLIANVLRGNQIKPKSLTLIVTHGVFSKGLTGLFESFDRIITTNTYQEQVKMDLLTTVRMELL